MYRCTHSLCASLGCASLTSHPLSNEGYIHIYIYIHVLYCVHTFKSQEAYCSSVPPSGRSCVSKHRSGRPPMESGRRESRPKVPSKQGVLVLTTDGDLTAPRCHARTALDWAGLADISVFYIHLHPPSASSSRRVSRCLARLNHGRQFHHAPTPVQVGPTALLGM